MLSLYEKKEQLFGEFRTGVFTKNRNINSVISSMKNGNCFVTNGPFINLTFENNGSVYGMGSVISSNLGSFKISIISTSEFGKIKDITLIKGVIKEQKENDFFTILNYGDYELEKYIEINIESECYFRCIVELESISSKGVEDEQGDIVFSREMSSIAKNMGGKILLCDDLSDTGITLNKSVDWLKKYEPIKGKIEDIKTATLWKKKKSTFDPDFCAVKLPDNPWIVQPFEIYEEIRIEEILKKHHK